MVDETSEETRRGDGQSSATDGDERGNERQQGAAEDSGENSGEGSGGEGSSGGGSGDGGYRPGVGSDPATDKAVAEEEVEQAFIDSVDEGRRRLSRRAIPLLATGTV